MTTSISATASNASDARPAVATPRDAPHPYMLWIPGGTFLMGSDDHYPEEAPVHRVTVDGFWMDQHTVTNEEFARFVKNTRYVTLAERAPDPADYPGATPDLLVPASVVFQQPAQPVSLDSAYHWWTYVPGASWHQPQGPGSSVKRRADHPVVHVAWEDVAAYARWAGKDLPTEAEWEYAARGGLEGATYAWGEDFTPGGRWMADTWQGDFPMHNTSADGHAGTAPVGSYPANGYDLVDMTGNVWEWTADWYGAHEKVAHACCSIDNPRGSRREGSHDPAVIGTQIPRRVMKGGSHLCAPNYCRRYRPAARMAQPVDTSTSHLGFRCIVRHDPAGAVRGD
jgi:formylglycine-generating enzyme